MTQHVYAISVNKENMEEMKRRIKKYGGSVSKMLDTLILNWLNSEVKKDVSTKKL